MIDLISNGSAQGSVAAQLQANGSFNIGQMRPFVDPKTGASYVTVFTGGDAKKPENYRTLQVNAGTLRRDEWKMLDDAIKGIAEQRLNGVDDLTSRGLTYTLGNAMGTTVLEWHDMSDAMEAQMTMDGVTRTQGDRPVFQYNYLPIPIIHVDYEINMRALEASRKLGNPLDTVSAERAARKVRQHIEDMFFTNTTYSFGTKDERNRNSIYSYLSHPDRNQVTLSQNWDASGKTGAEIIADVKAMKEAARAAYHYGPFVLYIPGNYETVLDDDYNVSGNSLMTIKERIMKLDNIVDVKVVDRLPDDNVVLVQVTSDVVRLVNGMGLTNVQWKTEGDFITKYKVMAIQVPQIRSDANGKTGIVHLAA